MKAALERVLLPYLRQRPFSIAEQASDLVRHFSLAWKKRLATSPGIALRLNDMSTDFYPCLFSLQGETQRLGNFFAAVSTVVKQFPHQLKVTFKAQCNLNGVATLEQLLSWKGAAISINHEPR